MTPTVFFYNIPQEKISALKKVCMTSRLRASVVVPSQFTLPLRDLIVSPQLPAEPESIPAFPHEMLLFSSVAPGQLDQFLKGMRKAGIPPIPLKAMVTATNLNWNSLQLHEELSQECAAMAKGAKVHQNGQSE